MDHLEYFLKAFAVVSILFMVYCILVVFPVILVTEAGCLRKGYPEARVTIGLEQYCVSPDGAVIVNVKHLSQEKKASD